MEACKLVRPIPCIRTLRSITTAVFAFVLFAFPGAVRSRSAPGQEPDPLSDFRQRLRTLADFSPNPCGPRDPKGEYPVRVESLLFQQAADIVIRDLNATPAGVGSPRERATEALKKLERASAEINAPWPEENRFHFQVVDLPPVLVLEVRLRADGRFFVVGIPEEDSGQPNRLWKEVGSDHDFFDDPDPFPNPFDLYPLHRGPSGRARFLVKVIHSGCAGSIGGSYGAWEWDPTGSGHLDQIIKQGGALGLDDKVPGFAQIGELRTEGPLITLPYCWFSPIDTWDNPSLCAVDAYDISGDDVRFRSRAFNRPDLLPIAKAIEYAQARDYPAVLAYCVSSQVARKLVHDAAPFIYVDDLRVTHTKNGNEHVELRGNGPAYRFDVEKRVGRWLVVAFSAE